MTIQRWEERDDKGLRERIEFEEVGGKVERRRTGPDGKTERRDADEQESSRYRDWLAGETKERNERTLTERMDTALTQNKTYLGIATTTAAQDKAQIKALTKQVNGLLRLVGRKLDDVDDA